MLCVMWYTLNVMYGLLWLCVVGLFLYVVYVGSPIWFVWFCVCVVCVSCFGFCVCVVLLKCYTYVVCWCVLVALLIVISFMCCES